MRNKLPTGIDAGPCRSSLSSPRRGADSCGSKVDARAWESARVRSSTQRTPAAERGARSARSIVDAQTLARSWSIVDNQTLGLASRAHARRSGRTRVDANIRTLARSRSIIDAANTDAARGVRSAGSIVDATNVGAGSWWLRGLSNVGAGPAGSIVDVRTLAPGLAGSKVDARAWESARVRSSTRRTPAAERGARSCSIVDARTLARSRSIVDVGTVGARSVASRVEAVGRAMTRTPPERLDQVPVERRRSGR